MISNKKVVDWKNSLDIYRIGDRAPAVFMSNPKHSWMSLSAPIEMDYDLYSEFSVIRHSTIDGLFRYVYGRKFKGNGFGYHQSYAYRFLNDLLDRKIKNSPLLVERLKEINNLAYIVYDIVGDDDPSEEDLYWGVKFDGKKWRGLNEFGNLWSRRRVWANNREADTYLSR